jgi:proteasome alpha subunit
MIEEPYRWVEAIANRREYIETQLAAGSPIAAVGYQDGILFVTLGRSRQKIFEIYDRIAMGAIGHPGDIERLRMAAIELASTEGFTRSAADVSLRRLAHYSLSSVMKSAFEQVYGAPFLARLLFAEIGSSPKEDLFLRIDYDGAIAANGLTAQPRQRFAVLSGTRQSAELMEKFLQKAHVTDATLPDAINIALDAWSVGRMAMGENASKELPAPTAVGMSNLPVPELKRLCSSATARARFVIEFCRTRTCAPASKGSDVSRAIRLRGDNEKHCRVARAFAHGRIVRLVANPFHSAPGNFDATHGCARAIYPGCSRPWPRRPGFWRRVRRDF